MSRKIDVEKELLKEAIEYAKNHKPTEEEIEAKKDWNKRIKHICKPCWELKYCPYGSLVEQFPPLGPIRKEAIEHNEFLKKQLAKGAYPGWRKKSFSKEVKEFNPKNYPVKHSKDNLEKSCSIFGHQCPVFFVNEPFTETAEMRRISRYIPRHIMLRVARRDNYHCQICGKFLSDNEIIFDHSRIPFSKGGPGEEHNLQLTCFDCNQKKRDKVPSDL